MTIAQILLIASILPSVILMDMVYKKDKVEKEPREILTKLFLLGIAIVVPVGIIELVLDAIIIGFIDPETKLYIAINAFLIIAAVEEGFKYLVLRKSTWKDKNFNYTFDAVVYAVFASLGFATLENVLYVFGNGLLVAIIRGICSVPGHMTFGVLMGVYYGRAKMCEKLNDEKGQKHNLLMSVLIPTLLHGLFDYCLMVSTTTSLIVFGGVIIFIYINMFRNLKRYSIADKKIEEIAIVENNGGIEESIS